MYLNKNIKNQLIKVQKTTGVAIVSRASHADIEEGIRDRLAV